jgi:hypothetical protein
VIETPTRVIKPRRFHAACEAIFTARALGARRRGREPRTWPCVVAAHPHWANDYTRTAACADVAASRDDGVTTVNAWVSQIAAAQSVPAKPPRPLLPEP